MPETDESATDDQVGEEQDQTQQDESQTEKVDWKQTSRMWEKRAKANADAAQKLAELEDAGKSEAEKLAKKLAEAEQQKANLELRVLRAEVATAKGLSPTMAARLQGSDRDELEADADALLAELKATQRPDLKQGARGSSQSGKDDGNEWLRRLAGSRSTL